MFRLNLKIALRNLWKNKGYTAINILGLSIGMASCILIFIFINFQLSFDKKEKKGDRIYRFVSDWKYNSFDDTSEGIPIPLGAAAKNDFAGFEKTAMIVKSGGTFLIKDAAGKAKIKEDRSVYYAEADFFNIFDFNWVAGSPTQIAEPNTVLLDESAAIKYFGDVKSAMGKNMIYNNGTNLKVVGVFADQPENSSFPLKIVASYSNFQNRNNADWESVGSLNQCYVLAKEGVSLADLQKPLKAFNDKYFTLKNLPGKQSTNLQPLYDIHFSEKYGNFAGAHASNKEIIGLSVIGLFLMLTACINFINLATAQAINRSKEVGVRKVMGSGRKQLVIQFLTETFTITIIALLIACVISELSIPMMQNLFNVKVAFSLFANPIIFLFMFLLVLLVSFLAGFYPALIMSGFSPALAIKNKVTVNSGNLSLRKILVIVQFAITIILIISTLVIIRQMQYVREKPLGFDTKAIVMIKAPADSLNKTKRTGFTQRIMQIPGIQALSYCVREPLSQQMNTTNFTMDGVDNKDFEVRLTPSDENYINLFGLKIISGKIYQKSDTANGYIVNETFLKKVNITNPETALGKIVVQNGRRAPIIGVVKDFNDVSLKENISPMLIYPEARQYYQAAIRMDSKRIIEVMKQVEAIWNETYPTEVYDANFVDTQIDGYYNSEKIMGILFKTFASVIIFISFIGLFGLISFVATQRTKEIAIRRVLGATTIELVKMLNGSFLMMVFIANIVAWPLAYLFVSKWLSGYAYRIDIGIRPFLFAMAISMFITLLTVSIRSYRAAMANTINALKYE
ncbi:ABC transporter permease [Pedobacter nototheniae]|uniref:ABC transporter permease n=1 Tax=Pedobacter nototheniae TaxID=2488994 RepID=UPI00292FB958|nr:ABC transporter permease [Pedobacter nototheniae]